MADATPVFGKKRKVDNVAVAPPAPPVETPVDQFPESLREAAQAALDKGLKVELTRRNQLRIYAG